MGLAPIDIYYFSGTGNTWRVVDRLRETFETKGIPVNVAPIQDTDPADIDPAHTLGLAFPVACQSTYPFVWEFLRGLPAAEGTGVFMVDTLEAFSGGIVGPLGHLLGDKGYTLLGAKEVTMPSNILRRRLNQVKDDATIHKGLQQAEAFAAALVEGTADWRGLPVLSPVLCYISTRPRLWRFMRWLIPLAVDLDACTACGLCASLCPVNNIRINDKAEIGTNCQLCMRCSAFCPEQAINSPRWNFKPYRAATAAQLTAGSASVAADVSASNAPAAGK